MNQAKNQLISSYTWAEVPNSSKAKKEFALEGEETTRLLFDSKTDPNKWVLWSNRLPYRRQTLGMMDNKFHAIQTATNILRGLKK